MRLFVFLLWCAAVVGRCAASNILSYNSRLAEFNSQFGEFNSRLGPINSRLAGYWELAGKTLIYFAVFGAKSALFRHNRENSRFNGKNREFLPAVRRPKRLRERRLKRFSGGSGENVGLAIEGGDKAVDAVGPQDGGEFGAAGRHLANRAVEIDVGDQPALTVAAHHVVDLDRLAIGFDDLAAHHDARGIRLFARDLQFLSGIAVEAVGVDRRDVAPEALHHLLALRLGQRGPGRTDRQPRHRGDVKGPANDRLQLRKAPALPERPAVLHRAEECVVEALHGIAAVHRRGMERIGHGEGQHRCNTRSSPRWRSLCDRWT